MKQAMINYAKAEKNDILYTPPAAVRPLLNYIPGWIMGVNGGPGTVWEPCDPGRSAISDVLRGEGINVISSDIRTGTNFLTDPPPGIVPPSNFDMIITNPPYSLKDDFIARCYEIGKPWAMLMPLTALEGKRRGRMFREKGIDVVVLDGRVNFMAGKRGVWFNTSWFLWSPTILNQIFFEKLEKA